MEDNSYKTIKKKETKSVRHANSLKNLAKYKSDISILHNCGQNIKIKYDSIMSMFSRLVNAKLDKVFKEEDLEQIIEIFLMLVSTYTIDGYKVMLNKTDFIYKKDDTYGDSLKVIFKEDIASKIRNYDILNYEVKDIIKEKATSLQNAKFDTYFNDVIASYKLNERTLKAIDPKLDKQEIMELIKDSTMNYVSPLYAEPDFGKKNITKTNIDDIIQKIFED